MGSEWAIEDKGTNDGKDPFTLRKQDKKMGVLKNKKKELKNYENRENELNKNKEVKEKSKRFTKDNNEGEVKSFKKVKNQRLETDKKGLSKTLETVQKSTASMGKFDKKLKNEKQLDPLKKNKISKDILLNRKSERDRDRKILDNIVGTKKAKKA